MSAFVHLHSHSPFSFLDGASSIRDMVAAAADVGMTALALTDHSNVSGGVIFYKAALEAGIKPIQGAEVTLKDGGHLVLLARGPEGYGQLCRILTRGHLGSHRLDPRVGLAHLGQEVAGGQLIALSGCRKGRIPSLLLRQEYGEAESTAREYLRIFGADNFYLELQGDRLPGNRRLNRELAELSDRLGVGIVLTTNAHYARKEDFSTHDLLTCVRTLTKVDDVHPQRRLNAENYLKPCRDMVDLLDTYPAAGVNTVEIAERCEPVFDLSKPRFPSFAVSDGTEPFDYLKRLVVNGARKRYGRITPTIDHRLRQELTVIRRLGYEDYFLVVWDVARYARQQGIRHAGRGSAADSAVAYCLGITEVDSIARGLLFERFLSLERAQKPDIDIDFDARYRDRVADYVYKKYGEEHVAAVATYNTFRGRSALRDLGKAMDFPPKEIDFIAKRLSYRSASSIEEALQEMPELRDHNLPVEKYKPLLEICQGVAGFPRHLGTHLGGLIICRHPLTDITPLQQSAKGVNIIQFDKRDVEDLGLMKLDLLSLRTLSVLDDAVKNLGNDKEVNDGIPVDDSDTYKMINSGETIGVFQLESPAQRGLQARLEASNFEDIVASLALIRPGPIKGNMVEPFVARRLGNEPVTYLHPDLEPILKKTYGVILFQEQVIEIATVIGGFTPGEADKLRRVMSHARSMEEMEGIGLVFIEKATARGVERQIAEEIYRYIQGYASYGFCEAHAAAFANTAYKTAYLVRHHPTEFFAAILSHQPMGYYPLHTVCTEARRKGVEILSLDINKSSEDFQVEGAAIRPPLTRVKSLSQPTVTAVKAARQDHPFSTLKDFIQRVPRANRREIENLILAGAFDPLHSNRRQMLWDAATWAAQPEALGSNNSGEGRIEDFSPLRRCLQEYSLMGFSPGRHFMDFFRDRLKERGFYDSLMIKAAKQGEMVKVAGLVVTPHRPPTRSGRTIVFLSLEDEFGLVDITVFEDKYQQYGKVIFQDPTPPLMVLGQVESRGQGRSVIARQIRPMVSSW